MSGATIEVPLSLPGGRWRLHTHGVMRYGVLDTGSTAADQKLAWKATERLEAPLRADDGSAA